MAREIYRTQYNSAEHTDENALAQLQLREPDRLARKLTYLWGQDSNKFSLLSMTEGQKDGWGYANMVNDIEYTWDVMGKDKRTAKVVRFPAGIAYPGIGRSTFQVVFDSNRLIPDYSIMAPDKTTKCHIHGEPEKLSENEFLYTLQMNTVSNTAYVAASNLVNGKSWIMLATHVPESNSRGNRSNRRAPGKMKNQIHFNRYTKQIAGNAANKVVGIQFPTEGGGTTNLWINEEQKQFEIELREANNIDLYTTEYNRDATGEIHLKYWETGDVIPMGAGVKEMVTETGNTDTYGLTLPLNKVKQIVGDVFWDGTDNGKMEVVIHCGQGFAEDFDAAVKTDIASRGTAMFSALGDKSVASNGGYLAYNKGAYFNQYYTITGHLVTLKIDDMFDGGFLGQLDSENGNFHPVTGYPMSSHTGIFIDYSIYEGERNVQLLSMKGQTNLAGVVKGLAPLPASWKVVGVSETPSQLSNSVDASSYEIKQARGINIFNANHCFYIESVL